MITHKSSRYGEQMEERRETRHVLFTTEELVQEDEGAAGERGTR